jgi:hypothetical protein
MSLTGGGDGGVPSQAVNPWGQRCTVVAAANLFEILLDCMGKVVYQYNGLSSHVFQSTQISSWSVDPSHVVIHVTSRLNAHHPRHQSGDQSKKVHSGDC